MSEQGPRPIWAGERTGGARAAAVPGAIVVPTVSVIVPVFRGGPAFEQCLTSLWACVPSADELIVVVDGGDPVAVAAAKYAKAKVIVLEERQGPAMARNAGAQAAIGQVLFFVDADVLVPPGAITQVRKLFRENPEVVAMMGSYDDAPAADNFLSQYKNLLHHYVHQRAGEEAFTFWTGCGAVRRGVFLKMGGFSDQYAEPSVEDIEFGYRLRAAGHAIRLSHDLQVTHLKRWTPRSLLTTDLHHRAIPWTELILAAGRFDDDLNIDRRSRWKVVLVYLMLLSLLPAVVWPIALVVPLALAVTLWVMDLPLWRFFVQKRGVGFAVRALPWQWFYYLYCGLGFVIGWRRHRRRRRAARKAAKAKAKAARAAAKRNKVPEARG